MYNYNKNKQIYKFAGGTMQTKTIVSYISASSFDYKMNEFLRELEQQSKEVIEIQCRHNCFMYMATIIYK